MAVPPSRDRMDPVYHWSWSWSWNLELQVWNITQDATIFEGTSTFDSSETFRQDRLGFELASPVFTLSDPQWPTYVNGSYLISTRPSNRRRIAPLAYMFMSV